MAFEHRMHYLENSVATAEFSR